MSSILDALKKLEEEAVTGSGLEPGMRRKAGAGHKVRFFLADRSVFLLVAAVLVGLGAAGYWGYDRFALVAKARLVETVKPVEKLAAVAPAPAAAPAATPSIPAPGPQAARMPDATPMPAPKAEPVLAPQPKPEAAIAPGQTQLTEMPAELPKPEAELRVPKQQMEAQPETEVVTEEPLRNPEPEIRSIAQATPPEPEFPVLDSSALTLQAISWATDATKRIAVINGSICREGARVDGFIIRRINPEDILVNDGKTTWMLPFQLK